MELPICDLSLGEPRRSIFPGALCKDVLDREAINHYYPTAGLPELRRSIHARFYADIPTAAYRIFITHGAIQALDLLLRATLRAGDEILIPDPGFPPYRQLAQFAKARVRTYAMPDLEFSIATLAAALTADTRVLLINSPHNPTGAVLSVQQREELRDMLRSYPDLLVISDEVYGQIVYDGREPQSLIGLTPRTCVINSFSKTFALQGLRIGWMAVPRGDDPDLKPYLLNSMGAVSSVGQEIVLKLLLSPEWQPAQYQSARDRAAMILQDAGLVIHRPAGSFFMLVEVGDDRAIAAQLAQEGVRVTPGSIFGSGTRGWIRTCFAQSDLGVERDFRRLAMSLRNLRGQRGTRFQKPGGGE